MPEGEHMQLARQLDAYLRARGGDALNMLGYIAAFVLDSDISVEEGYRLFTLSVNAGVHACYSEAADAPAGAFLPWRTDDVEYVGVPAARTPCGRRVMYRLHLHRRSSAAVGRLAGGCCDRVAFAGKRGTVTARGGDLPAGT
jgi:hypothetical protein